MYFPSSVTSNSAPYKYSVLTLWKIFVGIENSPALLKPFIRSNANSSLVQLVIHKMEYEECEDFAFESIDCNTDGGDILRCILLTGINCLLNNKAKNINSTTSCPKGTQRKILKLNSS